MRKRGKWLVISVVLSLLGSYLAMQLIQQYWQLTPSSYGMIYLVICLAILVTIFQVHLTWQQQKAKEQQHDDRND